MIHDYYFVVDSQQDWTHPESAGREPLPKAFPLLPDAIKHAQTMAIHWNRPFRVYHMLEEGVACVPQSKFVQSSAYTEAAA